MFGVLAMCIRVNQYKRALHKSERDTERCDGSMVFFQCIAQGPTVLLQLASFLHLLFGLWKEVQQEAFIPSDFAFNYRVVIYVTVGCTETFAIYHEYHANINCLQK